MTRRPLRVALVGCGAMGRLHARALRADPTRFSLVGGLDVEPNAARALDLAPLGSMDEAVAAAEVLVIATPIETHAALVVAALEAGRDVFVEKPSGASFREAAALVEAARQAGRRLFVGHSERFNPVVRTVVALLHGQKPRRIDVRRTAAIRVDRRGRGARGPREQGVLLNLGVHDMDLVAYLTGAPLRVAWAEGSHESADVALVAGGCEAQVHVARTHEPRERRLVVTTETHRFEGDLLHRELRVTELCTEASETVPVGDEEPVVLQMRALGASLLGGEDVALARELATGMDGARAVLAVETASQELGARHLEGASEPPSWSAENL